MKMPAVVRVMVLWVNVTSCTTHQVQPPLSFRGVNRTEKPVCPSKPGQLFSNVLPSISTRCAFFNSRWFFTPHVFGYHVCSLRKWLPRTSMSEGTRRGFVMVGSCPPHLTFTPAASN